MVENDRYSSGSEVGNQKASFGKILNSSSLDRVRAADMAHKLCNRLAILEIQYNAE